MSYVIGLDLGTSALKGLVLNKNGEVVLTATSAYPLLNPKPGYSEQDPAEWIRATDEVLTELVSQLPALSSELEGISISGQMHGLVTLDSQQEVVRPAILWNDTRTTGACERITETLSDELISITKNKALEGFTLPKIVWMQEYEIDLWQQVDHIMLPKDFLVYYLTGRLATDYSDAAGTLLLDINTNKWSEMIMDTFNLSKSLMPELYNSVDSVGILRESLAEKHNLPSVVKIAAGGADNACAAVGSGIVTDDIGMVSIGTSGVFLSFEEASHTNYGGQLHLFNHAKPESYYSMGVTLAAGDSLRWFRNTFSGELSYEDLLHDIDQIAPGSDGLLFAPYIVGERTPYADSQIRGSFIGIDTKHTLTHFARAVLEGITFSLKDSQQLMEQLTGKSFKKIISVGGGAKNKEWLQIQADIFDAEIVTLQSEQGPGIGAAYCAMIACGWYDDLQDCTDHCVSYKQSVHPNKNQVQQYSEIYKSYQKIYSQTKPICKRRVNQ